jgi:hypothetical protein
MRRHIVLVVAAGVTAAALAGCQTPTGTTAASAPAASPAPAGGPLMAVHDPGHVTYTGGHPTGCHAGAGPTPDHHCTPGAVDPAVTQATIDATVCRSGYTATVRPPVAETNTFKAESSRAYGVPGGTASELDHLVPLVLGGANDSANLWPEIGKIPNPKDQVETTLARAVCGGKVRLVDAQNAIAADWTTAEKQLGLANVASAGDGE